MSAPEQPPWGRLEPGRVFTVADVRRRCESLPIPGRRFLGFEPAEPRVAGTLLPVVEVDGEAALVLTRRPSTMTFHRGDWVFPGGRMDTAVDKGPEDTARRETSEELGIPLDAIEVVGALDVHGPIVTGFVIHPFVGVLAPKTPLAPDPREVEETEIVPLSRLLTKGTYRVGQVAPDHVPGPTTPGDRVGTGMGQLQFFRIRDGEDLWGTQAEFLVEFLRHLAAED
jgi:8-oxo-dGTP pyrophosphatase MutT (NUDIX family)